MRGLYLTAVILHVLAAMTWMGGMVIFVAALLPAIRRQGETTFRAVLHDFSLRFRTMSWICFGILIPTGAFSLWMRGVTMSDFFRPEWRSTSFGRLVLAKLCLVLGALAIALIHERVASPRQARWLGRSLLVVGLAIVAVAIQLVRPL